MEKDIKTFVRQRYAKVATGGGSCCGPQTSCCGPQTTCCGSPDTARDIGKRIGYSDEELGAVPEGANLGLGCGNPIALASLKEGETVLDLGSGAGFDCFLAASKVGKSGKVIGVDMTPDMIDKARGNAEKGDFENVEFRLGEIENLPAADNSVDVIISNCVVNLSPEKDKVFREAFRVLKPGGRLMVSDIVLLNELPEAIRNSISAYVSCIAGASMKQDYLGAIKSAGFESVEILEESGFSMNSFKNDPTVKAVADDLNLSPAELADAENTVSSIRVRGIKQ